MGDRVAVMKNGRLQQCAAPQDLYDHPANVFVAGFIGSPKMNLFTTTLQRQPDGSIAIGFGSQVITVPAAVAARWNATGRVVDGIVTVGIRPEGLRHTPDASPESSIQVEAAVVEMLGSETLVFFVAPVEQASDADVRDRAQASDEEESILASDGSTVMCARLVPPLRLAPGDGLRLTIQAEQLYLFDAEGEAIS